MAMAPITSFNLKSCFGLKGWLLWHVTQAAETARSG